MLALSTLGSAARLWSSNVDAALARCNDLERTHFGDLCLGVGTCATLARRNLFLCGLEAAARRTSSGGPQIGTLPQKHTPTVHPEMGCRGREPWRTLVKDFTPAHSADLHSPPLSPSFNNRRSPCMSSRRATSRLQRIRSPTTPDKTSVHRLPGHNGTCPCSAVRGPSSTHRWRNPQIA